jgi:hypothetical protein
METVDVKVEMMATRRWEANMLISSRSPNVIALDRNEKISIGTRRKETARGMFAGRKVNRNMDLCWNREESTEVSHTVRDRNATKVICPVRTNA